MRQSNGYGNTANKCEVLTMIRAPALGTNLVPKSSSLFRNQLLSQLSIATVSDTTGLTHEHFWIDASRASVAYQAGV